MMMMCRSGPVPTGTCGEWLSVRPLHHCTRAQSSPVQPSRNTNFSPHKMRKCEVLYQEREGGMALYLAVLVLTTTDRATAAAAATAVVSHTAPPPRQYATLDGHTRSF